MTNIKEIPGHPGYGADEEGNVWSFKPCRLLPTPRIMKAQINKNGYAMIMVGINGERFNRTIHSLVARAFLGESPGEGYEVTHLNGNPTDNRPENLLWVTHKAGALRAAARGAYPKTHVSPRTPEFDPDEIIEILENGEKCKIFPIPNYAGYGVDRNGNVWRTKPYWKIGRKPKKMSPWKDNAGYARIGLSYGRKCIAKSVHQLVALTFCGQPPSKEHQVCHWDGNKLNNKPENLRWGTRIENSADTKRLGKHINPLARKFSPDQIREIRQSSRGVRYWATKLNCSPSTILQIRRRLTYAEII